MTALMHATWFGTHHLDGTRVRRAWDPDMYLGSYATYMPPDPQKPNKEKEQKTAEPKVAGPYESPFFPPAGANAQSTVPWESMAYDSKGGMYRPVPSNVLPPAPPPTGVPGRLAIAFMMAEAIAIVSAFILAQTLY